MLLLLHPQDLCVLSRGEQGQWIKRTSVSATLGLELVEQVCKLVICALDGCRCRSNLLLGVSGQMPCGSRRMSVPPTPTMIMMILYDQPAAAAAAASVRGSWRCC